MKIKNLIILSMIILFLIKLKINYDNIIFNFIKNKL
jgi:hypothetical protein